MQVGLKTWQAFKDRFSQAYRCYQILNKAASAAHGYGAAANHTQEIYAQVNTEDELQALACEAMEDKEEMANPTSINLTLSQILTQVQNKMLVLYKQLQAFQAQLNAKTPTTEIPVLDKKTKETKLKCYCWNYGRTLSLGHTSANCWFPKIWHQVEATLGNKIGGSKKFKEYKAH